MDILSSVKVLATPMGPNSPSRHEGNGRCVKFLKPCAPEPATDELSGLQFLF